MRWLKGLVIGMGALILVGLTVVIVEFARRAAAPPEPAALDSGRPAPPIAGAERAPAFGAAPAFGETRIALPPGALVEETVAAEGRLIVRLGLPDGHAALLLIDARTGRRLGLVRLEGGEPP